MKGKDGVSKIRASKMELECEPTEEPFNCKCATFLHFCYYNKKIQTSTNLVAQNTDLEVVTACCVPV